MPYGATQDGWVMVETSDRMSTGEENGKPLQYSCLENPVNSIKRQNDRILKRWQEYTKELYKKDLQDPDNHDGVITHLEQDILECEIKWALESITRNKAK